MPSPIGHALAGAAIAWSCGVSQPKSTGTFTSWKLPVACAVFAALPDVDLLYMPTHRTATHSVPVAILFTIVAAGVTGWVKPIREWCRTTFGESPAVFIGLACGLAWSSHILLDWLGADANPPYGVQELTAALTAVAGLAGSNTRVVIEHARRDRAPQQVEALVLTRELSSGDSGLAFYRKA